MKQVLYILAIFLFIGACKKEETKTITLAKSDLIGVWNIQKYEKYALPADTVSSFQDYVLGSYTWTFRSDDTAIIYEAGTPSKTTLYKYSISTTNGKNILVTQEVGGLPDYTLQIVKYDSTSMECDNKEALTANGDNHYDKYYLKKN